MSRKPLSSYVGVEQVSCTHPVTLGLYLMSGQSTPLDVVSENCEEATAMQEEWMSSQGREGRIEEERRKRGEGGEGKRRGGEKEGK